MAGDFRILIMFLINMLIIVGFLTETAILGKTWRKYCKS
mgnify:CR=1 FL=1